MFRFLVLTVSSLLEKPLSNGRVVVNQYVVVKHLGSGSYGHSYLVYDRKSKKQVVLKSLRLHKRITLKGRLGFQREMNLLKEIHHPSLPEFLESGSFNKIPFFTMEFIDGKTFEQLIFEEGKQFSEIETFQLGYMLLEVMEYLHKHNIVHRDIRIPNIMWVGETLKVIDVGLAKHLPQTDKRGKGRAFFHPRNQLDFKGDFYGLGHFLLFLLYSQYSPVKNQKEKSWEEELDITPQGTKVIRKLLQIDPPYESCEEIKQDFQKLIHESI
jgi:serine/threonine protein kinase